MTSLLHHSIHLTSLLHHSCPHDTIVTSLLSTYSLITSRVEVNILRSINPHFEKIKVRQQTLGGEHFEVNLLLKNMLLELVVYTHTHARTHTQDTTVKQNLIRTIDLIGRALHPDHLKSRDFVFNKRGDLITHLLVSNWGQRSLKNL